MEKDLASSIIGAYKGHLVFIDNEKTSVISLVIKKENSLRISIEVDLPVFGNVILFGSLSEQYEGVLICLDQKALPRSIHVIGVSGLFDNKPNVHGGKLKNGTLLLSLNVKDTRMEESSHISLLCDQVEPST